MVDFTDKYLTYKAGEVPEGVFKFSPSAFSSFIKTPWKWYRQQVMKEDVFTYSTSTVIGTIVHGIAAAVALRDKVDKVAIENYIRSFEVTEDYDPNTVRECYPEMIEALINEYVLGRGYLSVEETYRAEVQEGYIAQGTTDRLEGTMEDTCIVDFKSYSSPKKPTTIPDYYKYQLLVYAAILRTNGYNPTRMKLVYVNRPIIGAISPKTGKQFKSYPSEVTEITESITEDDFAFIESMLSLAADSLDASKQYPELVKVIWHDNRAISV